MLSQNTIRHFFSRKILLNTYSLIFNWLDLYNQLDNARPRVAAAIYSNESGLNHIIKKKIILRSELNKLYSQGDSENLNREKKGYNRLNIKNKR
jgi:hypothetical protein